MNFIKTLIGAVSGSFYGYIAAAIFGAAIAGGATFWLQGLRIDVEKARADTAEARIETAEQKVRTAEGDLKQCRDAAALQNEAVEAIEARAKKAEQAMDAADIGRKFAESKAALILSERTPANTDKCTAARKAFADELKQERGQ